MANTYRQIAVNLTADVSWTALNNLQTGLPYSVPGGGTAIAKSIRLMNHDSSQVTVQVAMDSAVSPTDARLITTPVTLEGLETAMIEGLVVLPSGWNIVAKADNPYPNVNVTVTAAVLEIT